MPDISEIREAILVAMERRHVLVDLIYEAEDEDDAKAKIVALLHVDGIAAGAILDQSLRQMLPGGRAHIQKLLAKQTRHSGPISPNRDRLAFAVSQRLSPVATSCLQAGLP